MDAHPKRTLVFQIIRLIIGALIAIALVKFAFFPSTEAKELPTGQGTFTAPTVTVERGSIENDVSLRATVVRDAATSVKATQTGVVIKVFTPSGTVVSAGAPVLQVRQTVESDNPELPAQTRYLNIASPAAGTLSLDVIAGQDVQIGQVIGSILPATFHAEVSVTPDQLYSLQSLPNEAELAITDGPEPFPCVSLHTVSGAPQPSSPDQQGVPQGPSNPQLRCSIPADRQVFDGVTGKLQITGNSAADVLTVPTTAVEGRYREGRVYLPGKDGKKPTPITIQLGVSDGTLVEVTGGIEEGTEILQFAPLNKDDKDSDQPNRG